MLEICVIFWRNLLFFFFFLKKSFLGKQAQISQQPTRKTKQAPKIPPDICDACCFFESGLLFHVLYAGYTAFKKGLWSKLADKYWLLITWHSSALMYHDRFQHGKFSFIFFLPLFPLLLPLFLSSSFLHPLSLSSFFLFF